MHWLLLQTISSLISVKDLFTGNGCCLTFALIMKQFYYILAALFLFTVFSLTAGAQCSVCTKTALQMGEKPAQGLNQGILYLMWMPFAIVGFIAYRWWKSNRQFEEQESLSAATPQ